MALDVVTAGGTLTVINVHGPGSGGDSWASKASFWADVAMYAAAKSAGGTRAVLLGGDFNVWLESPWHPTTRRFQALWEQCGFHRAGPEREEDRRPTRAGHRLDSFLLNSPLVPWAARERPHLAPGRSPASLGSDHGPVVLDIPLAVAGKGRVTRMAYSHAQGRLHAIRPDSPGFREAVAAVLQKACGDQRLQAWLSSDQDTATMGTSEVQAVFDLLYAFRDDVSRVTGVRMPSGVDPQYPYGQAETEASLDQVLSDQQALAWRAHQLWQRDAAAAGLHSQEATALLQHLRRVDPDLSPASVEDLRAALDQQLRQLETRVEELRDVLRSNRRRSIKDYWRGRVPDLQLRWTAIRGAINVVNYAPSGLWSVRVRESEKVLLEASDVIGEVQRYWEALYAKRPVNLPAFERLVRAHIPKGVPEEWRSVQDYTMQDLKDAVRQAVADDKAPGSNRVTAALIAELPEPVQGLLVHAYRAILRGADVPESWHEAIIWLMPKGTATGNLDEYRPIALGQQDMRMLMTPLMRRFTAVLARKGLPRTGSSEPCRAPRRLPWCSWPSAGCSVGWRKTTSWPSMCRKLLTQRRTEHWRSSYATWVSRRSSSGSSTPSAAGPWCASSLRTARRRAYGSTGACGRAVRRALCSTSSYWSLSCGALPVRRGEMLATRCHPWYRRTVMTSC